MSSVSVKIANEFSRRVDHLTFYTFESHISSLVIYLIILSYLYLHAIFHASVAKMAFLILFINYQNVFLLSLRHWLLMAYMVVWTIICSKKLQLFFEEGKSSYVFSCLKQGESECLEFLNEQNNPVSARVFRAVAPVTN